MINLKKRLLSIRFVRLGWCGMGHQGFYIIGDEISRPLPVKGEKVIYGVKMGLDL
jgi:hypothetical protein